MSATSKQSLKSQKSKTQSASSKAEPIFFPYRAIFPGGPLRPALQVLVHRTIGPPLPLVGLIDSGADYSIVPLAWAKHLSRKPGECERRPCTTPTGKGTVMVHPIALETEIDEHEWRFAMRAAFNRHAPCLLLGRDDFFAAFTVMVDHPNSVFALTPREAAARAG